MKREITLADILKKIEECKQAPKQMKARYRQEKIDQYYIRIGEIDKVSDTNKFDYEINEKVAVLSENNNTTKEVNIITYNEQYKKLDIRNWSDGKMLKGITLSQEEALKLKEALNNLDFTKI